MEELARKLVAWAHPGFSAHVAEAIPFEDEKATKSEERTMKGKGEGKLRSRCKGARTLLWFLALPSAGVMLSPGSAAAQPYAYIPSYGGEVSTVSVIDTTTDTVVAVVPVAPAALGVAVNPAGTRVYVASQTVTADPNGTVSVIDAASNTVIATVPVGAGPLGVAVHPNGRRVYVANGAGAGTVSVIDAARNAVIATVPAGDNCSGVAVHPNGSRLYVTGGGGMSVIDTTSNTEIASVPPAGLSGGVAVHPDGKRVYAATYEGSHGTLSVIDTSTNAIATTADVGMMPFGVAVHSDGSRVYTTNRVDNTVSVVDTNTNELVGTVLFGPGVYTAGLAVHPDRERLYVAADGVTVIDTETNSIVGVVPLECCQVAFGQFIGPRVTVVNVDIKPGPNANAISLKTKGVIPVAILTSDTLDAALVDSSTVRFGATGIEAAAVGSTLKDVNRDGHLDMVLDFSIKDTGIECGQTMASLTGRTSGAQAIIGSDSIVTTGCR